MRVFVDDERKTPNGFNWRVWDYNSTITLLKTGQVQEISLDHDLGEALTGYDIVCWIEEEIFFKRIPLPLIRVHSANPIGRERIQQVIDKIKGF
jgi:hypothetical protein